MDDELNYGLEAQDRLQRAGTEETGTDLERFYLSAAQVYATLDLAKAVREAVLAIGELKEPIAEVTTAVAALCGEGEAIEEDLDNISDSMHSLAVSLGRMEPEGAESAPLDTSPLRVTARVAH